MYITVVFKVCFHRLQLVLVTAPNQLLQVQMKSIYPFYDGHLGHVYIVRLQVVESSNSLGLVDWDP